MKKWITNIESYISRMNILVCFFLVAVCFILIAINPIQAYELSDKILIDFINENGSELKSSEQVIFVVGSNQSSPRSTVYFFEKNKGQWSRAYQSMPANIGKNGLASFGKKIEGDMKTPSGIFPIGLAFGYEQFGRTKMTYRLITDNDFWVDDVNSDSYNKWVVGKPKSGSYEIMRRKDGAYRYGFVVEYNTNPIVKSKGSAIFFHVMKGETNPTAGCVSLSEGSIVKLIHWLDPAKQPKVIIGTELAIASQRLYE